MNTLMDMHWNVQVVSADMTQEQGLEWAIHDGQNKHNMATCGRVWMKCEDMEMCHGVTAQQTYTVYQWCK